jgi:xanthine dehydrogenase small subunit
VCGAFAMVLERGRVRQIRIAFGGMAATPQRASRCEAALLGKPWEAHHLAGAIAALDEDFAPLSDHRASAAYRRLVARNLLRKFHLETSDAPGATRVLAEVLA